jgi:hypothetical protein
VAAPGALAVFAQADDVGIVDQAGHRAHVPLAGVRLQATVAAPQSARLGRGDTQGIEVVNDALQPPALLAVQVQDERPGLDLGRVVRLEHDVTALAAHGRARGQLLDLAALGVHQDPDEAVRRLAAGAVGPGGPAAVASAPRAWPA